MAKNADEFEILGDDSTGDLAYLRSYQKLDIDAKNALLETSVKAHIIALCDLYLDMGKLSNEDYVKAIADTEKQNLLVLIKQVTYSEHILDTLMRQLDSGGYIDQDIFKTIREMQRSVIQITLEVSKYTRQLPEYFKFVQTDIKKMHAITMLEETNASLRLDAATDIEHEQISSSNDVFSISQPQRGLRELMLNVSDARDDLRAAMLSADAIIATPIPINEDDDEDDDELEEFKDFDED